MDTMVMKVIVVVVERGRMLNGREGWLLISIVKSLFMVLTSEHLMRLLQTILGVLVSLPMSITLVKAMPL
jgi:hypothetical protein